ncbi:MAG: aspartate aminotransferase family protein [Betaproteobacteria bacterium]|jgi:beta-alanine--pyruvate transaminase|nr:aspartate aminotransferase family protein [Betaproteobacteria bacterium]MBT7427531.1 aspartate aminotransferase family protein [Betaproteobacteria bacterium]MBT7998177.1 aspartate aminotransferase family protein [Betaproteobacteria bacterium]
MNSRDDLAVNEINQSINMRPLWLPFTPNRQFKASPRLIHKAQGMFYETMEGKEILDGISGLWCVNAGHAREPIIKAIQKQARDLDYITAFNMAHPLQFQAAEMIANLAPEGLDTVFFTNSGSEAIDTALKMALGYHRAKGEHRHRLVGRERGYHGVGFGGISVGGMTPNRKVFSPALIPGVDHISHTHNPEKNAYSKGQPHWGAHLAEDLERIVMLHDQSNIAAVIVEPVAGSTGVLVPPIGYLQKLREICDKYGILLIFDEVITGFGRTGNPFAADTFGVTPDMITFAKGVTNGAVPMGGVIVSEKIYEAFQQGPEEQIEFFHGYTYSGHPLASAAAIATLDVYKEEDLFERTKDLAPYFEEAIHSLKGLPHVIDIRNMGLMGGVELKPIAGSPGKRAHSVFTKCYENGVLVRAAGDTIALTPSFIASKSHIDQIVGTIKSALKVI